MRNQKVKTGLTAVLVIAIFLALTMCMITILTEDGVNEPFLYTWGETIGFDPIYGSIFVAFLAIALITWCIKIFAFTKGELHDKMPRASLDMSLELLVGLGLIMAFIGFFLPIGYELGASYDWNVEPARIAVCRIFSMIGLPLAFIASIGTVGISLRAKK